MWSGRTRLVVLGSALVAGLLRFQGLFEPLHADEAGFLIVARTWHPTPTSLYGEYFVDRPPPLIALFKLSDWIGGPYFIRVLGVLSCMALVLLAARTAHEVTGRSGTAAWVAVTAGALVGFTGFDAAATKGELLGIPWVLGSALLALIALRRDDARLALAAGFVAMVPVGLKQNLVGGLVFGGLLLLVSALERRLPWRRFGILGGAALAGAAVPVCATLGWTMAAGVRLRELWYATFGFRIAANHVIANGPTGPEAGRLADLLLLALGAGMITIVVLFAITAAPQWRRDRALLIATAAMVTTDVVGVLLGGSYWSPYLFNPIPSVLLGLIGMLATGGRVAMAARVAVAWPIIATVVSVGVLVGRMVVHPSPDVPYATGLAIGSVAHPGDSIVVYGGNAEIVFASELHDPYYLWSLPTRVLDPHLTRFMSLLDGPSPPTWLVFVVGLHGWGNPAAGRATALLHSKYVNVGPVCRQSTWRLRSAPRDQPHYPCRTMWHVW